MKKGIFLVILILIGMVIYVNAGTGRTFNSAIITSTGTTGIEFTDISKEIEVTVYSTNTVYTNWVSSYVMVSHNATNYYLLQRRAVTAEPDKHTEEVESSWMSIFSDTLPVDVRVQWKMWR